LKLTKYKDKDETYQKLSECCESILNKFSVYSTEILEEEDMFKFKPDLKKYKTILKFIHNKLIKSPEFEPSYYETEDDKTRRKNNIYRLICEISHASIYAYDVFFCYGAFMHIVYKNQKGNEDLKLDPICYKHSALDNFGFLLQVTSKEVSWEFLQFLKEGSKYIMRIYDAILCLKNEDEIRTKFVLFEKIRKKKKDDDFKADEELNQLKLLHGVKNVDTLLKLVKNDMEFFFTEIIEKSEKY